jgi:hypothetical protein
LSDLTDREIAQLAKILTKIAVRAHASSAEVAATNAASRNRSSARA